MLPNKGVEHEDIMADLHNTIRQFLLLSLAHTELRPNITPTLIVERITAAFECRSLIVAKELQAFHIRLLAQTLPGTSFRGSHSSR